MPAPLTVLSIDGGGIRGILPALVLQRLEERTGRPVASLFDVVAGTSTGAIIALALTLAGEGGRPRWRAQDVVGLYEREGPRIFARSVIDRVRRVDGVGDEKYPSDGLRRALRAYLGDARLRDALCEVLVTAYETERRSAFFFRRRDARDPARGRDFPVALVAEASAAAPTLFEAVRLETREPPGWLSLVDGGLFANNPAMCALVETRKHHPDRDVLIVSLGTGELTRRLPWEEIRDWGGREWALPVTPLLGVIFDGISDTVDHQVAHLVPEAAYFRFQVSHASANDDLDDASEGNLRTLRLEAARLLDERADELERLVAVLGARGGG